MAILRVWTMIREIRSPHWTSTSNCYRIILQERRPSYSPGHPMKPFLLYAAIHVQLPLLESAQISLHLRAPLALPRTAPSTLSLFLLGDPQGRTGLSASMALTPSLGPDTEQSPTQVFRGSILHPLHGLHLNPPLLSAHPGPAFAWGHLTAVSSG